MLSFEFCCIVQVPVLSVAFWDILLVPYNFMREKYTDIDIATSHPMSCQRKRKYLFRDIFKIAEILMAISKYSSPSL
jgi:hypothetical protein